jgi:hypothetical protein
VGKEEGSKVRGERDASSFGRRQSSRLGLNDLETCQRLLRET